MKKTIFAVILAALILVSCSGGSGEGAQTDGGSTSDITETAASSGGTETDSGEASGSLRDIIPGAVASGNFGEGMSLVYNDDEYADDLLEFAYGIEPDLAAKIDEYVLSEQSSMNAYSIAYFKLADGATADDVADIKAAVTEVYVGGLKASLEAYNPEAYALCDKAVFKELDGGLLFLICEESDVDAVVSAIGG